MTGAGDRTPLRAFRTTVPIRAFLVWLALAAPAELSAQGIVSGRALLPNSTRPLACVDAALRRNDGTVVARTFTREDGTFEFTAPAAGRYVIAFSTLGMHEAIASLDSLHPGSDLDRTFAVPISAVDSLLERVDRERGDLRFAQPASNGVVPRYPATELVESREGAVVTALVVRADGRIDPELSSFLYASAPPFEASVREAFAAMRYQPAQVDGQPRCSMLVLPYLFKLSTSGEKASASTVIGEVGALTPSVTTATPMPVQNGPCPPLPDDPEGMPAVYLPCQLDREAREVRSNASLDWEPAAGEIRPGACFRVELRFIVDSAGVPERGTIALVSTNNNSFGAAFAAMVPDLRFQPGRLKGRPVRQVVTYKESIGVRVTVDSGIGVGETTPSRRARC